jgi:hypothetical protein
MRLRVWGALLAALVAAGLSSGCVTRRVLITSDPPAAVVYKDGQYLGPTPIEIPFVYYGKYRFRLVADGYAPLDVEPRLYAPWYQYPGIDFIFENLLPFTFRDKQAFHFELVPLVRPLNADVQAAGEALRSRGAGIGQPGPRPPRPNRNPPAINNQPPPVTNTPPINGQPLPPINGQPAPPNNNGPAPNAAPSAADADPVNVAKPKQPGNAGFQKAPAPAAPTSQQGEPSR